MSLPKMRWFVYLVPPILLGGLELLRQIFFPELFDNRWLYVAFLAAAITGMVAFAFVVARFVEGMQAHLIHQNQELLALHHASLAISSDLRLETVLQRVVDEAADLVGARYGAISFSRSMPAVEAFVTHGIDDDLRARIGPYPVGKGLLGVTIASGQSLQVPHIADDPRSIGFPANHPPMDRLLAVPVSARTGIVGNLYLCDRLDGAMFTNDDEHTLSRFASLAAIAIDNALLHEQVQVLAITQERERIAREMHDSLAQVLAYVNTKSQAAIVHLQHHDPDRAQEQIEQLAASAREAYVDVREGIFALRSSAITPERTVLDALVYYAAQWQDQTGITVNIELPEPPPILRLPELSEIHLLRLVQEALTNVRKHANADTVAIDITASEREMCMTIRDNGRGFEPESISPGDHPRFGLSTMRERAEASGGSFDIRSTPGAGTTIDITLPFNPV